MYSSGTGKNTGSTQSTYQAVVNYRAGSESITEQIGASTSPPKYARGQEVPVVYHTNNPHQAVIDDWWDLYGLYTLFFSIGAIFAVMAVLISYRMSNPVGYANAPGVR